jgi:Amt family ammonium transporter
MFEFAFSAASATIVAGTLAERCQMSAYLCYSLVLAGFVYPIVSHAIWSSHGFLTSYKDYEHKLFGSGVVDFAGGGVVHLVGGSTALFATMILGPRRGRFHDDEGRKLDKPRTFPGHSIALQVSGSKIHQRYPRLNTFVTIFHSHIFVSPAPPDAIKPNPSRCLDVLFCGLDGMDSIQEVP